MPQHEPEEQDEVTTDEDNTVEEGEVYNILPKYLRERQPARCERIYWDVEGGSHVLKIVFRFTEDALERFQDKTRRLSGYDLDYVVFGDSEFEDLQEDVTHE